MEEDEGKEEGGNRERGRKEGQVVTSGLSFSFLLSLQRSLYSGLQSPGAPGPALGSFAFLPSGSAGAPNLV